MDQFFVWFQDFVSQIIFWLSAMWVTVSKEPVAWLALAVSVIFGVINYRFTRANYRLAEAKFQEENREKEGKVFSAEMTNWGVHFDPDLLDKFSDYWYDRTRAMAPDSWEVEIQRDYNFLPKYISSQLHFINSTTTPVLVKEILFIINCDGIASDAYNYIIKAKNLPVKDLEQETAQVLFFSHTQRKAIAVSEKNFLRIEPGEEEIIDAIIHFATVKVEPVEALRPTRVESMYVTGTTTRDLLPFHDGVTKLSVFMPDLALIASDRKTAKEEFILVEKDCQEWLSATFGGVQLY